MDQKPPVAAKPKKKLMKILTRAVSSITFQNHPSSPGRSKKSVAKADKHKSHHPSKEYSDSDQNLSVVGRADQEPTSPKISCMGHIRNRKKWPKNMNLLLRKEMNQAPNGPSVMAKPVLFLPETEKNIPSNASAVNKSNLIDRSASLSQMKRFGSSRGALSNFDWRTTGTGVDEKREEGEEDDEEEVPFSFFPPIVVAMGDHSGPLALETRKESNLWKRRAITQLKPIKVKSTVRI